MAPTLTRLLGAVAPKTEWGTIAGKPAAIREELPIPAAATSRALRREIGLLRSRVMVPPPSAAMPDRLVWGRPAIGL
jgi:hypothetical protein